MTNLTLVMKATSSLCAVAFIFLLCNSLPAAASTELNININDSNRSDNTSHSLRGMNQMTKTRRLTHDGDDDNNDNDNAIDTDDEAANGRHVARKLSIRDSRCTLYVADTQYSLVNNKEGGDDNKDGNKKDDTSQQTNEIVFNDNNNEDEDEDEEEDKTRTMTMTDIVKPVEYYTKQQVYCEFDKTYASTVLGLDDPLVTVYGISQLELNTAVIKTNRRRRKSSLSSDDSGGEEEFLIIQSGQSQMRFREGIVDRIDNIMYVDLPSVTEVIVVHNTDDDDDDDDNDEHHQRELEFPQVATIGKKKTLVVRVSTFFDGSDGEEIQSSSAAVSVSLDEIQKYVYNAPFSLKGKYEECSYGKLQINPYTGLSTGNSVLHIQPKQINDGILNVQLSKEQTDDLLLAKSVGNIHRYAREATELQVGTLKNQFDLVLFCLPPSVKTGFLASAVLNRYDSYYSQAWCIRPSFQIHEVGHNLGLKHSDENTNIVGADDQTGYMGASYNSLTGPNMCFNPVNSYRLGWYPEQIDTYNPLSSSKDNNNDNKGLKLFYLNGVDDYDEGQSTLKQSPSLSDERRLIALRLLQQDLDNDYYIGYNRKTGINNGVVEDENDILILEKFGPPESPSGTKKVGTLKGVGGFFVIKNFNNEGKKVFIMYQSLSIDGRDAVISVSTVRPDLSSPSPPKGSIVDKNSFKFNNDKEKSCSNWVAIRNTTKRCSRIWKGKSINEYWCPSTCNTNTCEDDATLRYKSTASKKEKEVTKNCDWIKTDPIVRCEYEWKKIKISEWCPLSCSRC